ncbi:HEPN domain-containing protein [Roseateles sp. BYS87W]|uniref:HEPN domain-containing protein n=1 Tax=Pelomonas baiyunensis TaxID=3299026 RepID=UPI003748599E
MQYLASTAWRKHVYAFAIVGVYGAHERFIRDFCAEVAVVISKIHGAYKKLPERMRTAHEKFSIERAQAISEGRTGDKADLQVLIANLHSCLEGGSVLNYDVFATSSANFRSHTVRETFSRLAIDLSNEEPEHLKKVVANELAGYYPTSFTVLDGLADLRNEIAHGSDFQTLDRGTLTSIVRVVHLYDHWLVGQVACSLKNLLLSTYGELVGTITKTYKGAGEIRSIGSLDSLAAKVSIGDPVHISKPNGDFEKSIVASIEFNSNPMPSAAGLGPFGIDFGILVREKAEVRRVPPIYAGIWAELELALTVAPTQIPGIQ